MDRKRWRKKCTFIRRKDAIKKQMKIKKEKNPKDEKSWQKEIKERKNHWKENWRYRQKEVCKRLTEINEERNTHSNERKMDSKTAIDRIEMTNEDSDKRKNHLKEKQIDKPKEIVKEISIKLQWVIIQ